jgi:hypothetical protein
MDVVLTYRSNETEPKQTSTKAIEDIGQKL